MIYANYPIDNYQLVRIQVNGAQPKYYFPDLPNLRRVKTFAISIYSSGIIPLDINNVPCVGTADTVYAYLTLSNKGNEQIFQQIDMNYFNSISVNTAYTNVDGYLPLNGQIFDFAKSFVEWPSTFTPATAYPFSLNFGIFYSYL